MGAGLRPRSYVGCSPSTIRNTAERDPQFAEQLDKAESRHEVGYLQNIRAASQKEQYWRAAAWALERHYPDRYGPRKAGTISVEQITQLLSQFAEIVVQELPDADDQQRIITRLEASVRRCSPIQNRTENEMTDRPDELLQTSAADGDVRAADRVASAASLSGDRVAKISTILRRQIKLARRRTRTAQTDVWPLLRWGQYYLPRHFRLEPSLMHRWLEAQLGCLIDRRGMKLNVVGPRGGAKSTIGTLAWPLRHGHRRARAVHLDRLRHQRSGHRAICRTSKPNYGESPPRRKLSASRGQGTAWQSNAITLPTAWPSKPMGQAKAFVAAAACRRPTLIICDDLENDQHIESARMRE